MNAMVVKLRRRLAGFAGFACKTLILYFFLFAALRLLAGDGGWTNEFMVFAILFCAFALGKILVRAVSRRAA